MDLVPIRAGLTFFSGEALVENFPNPSEGERVCFVSFLLRGDGFPIHPFLQGLLEYYGIQLHNLTLGSILHIAGFVALCELFLGCVAPRLRETGMPRIPAQRSRRSLLEYGTA